jgi:mannose-6-phosphate isomerase-like protein (cupin superfamily)
MKFHINLQTILKVQSRENLTIFRSERPANTAPDLPHEIPSLPRRRMTAVMDRISTKILNELPGRDKERPSRPAPKDERQPAADHWTRPILLERTAYLGKMARYGQGSAIETIKEYPGHCAMLWFRRRNSDAEVDESAAHILFVLDGRATLVTGGTRIDTTSIGGGVSHPLRPGDVVHIPATQPYQLLLEGENTVACLVFRIQESP